MYTTRRILSLPAFLLFVTLVFTQNAEPVLGSWNILHLRGSVAPKWSVFFEGQIRSLGYYRQFHYFEAKGGVSYSPLSHLTFVTGGGSYNTYQEGGSFVQPAVSREIRTWQEATVRQSLWKGQFEQRFRTEQRFTNNGYRNRFRARTAVQVPVVLRSLPEAKPFFLVWNELFFTDNEPYFERNRFYAGIGHRWEKVTLQLGYVHQFDYRIVDETGRDFALVSVVIDLKKNDNRRHHLPLQED